MKQKNVLISILLLIFAVECKSVNGQSLPKKNLSEYKETDFLLTLENQFEAKRNAIYCSSFLFAWQELKDKIKAPIQVDTSVRDLFLVNNSHSYINTLKKEEQSSACEIHGNVITLRSEFQKILLFGYLLFSDHSVFAGNRVASFGISGEVSPVFQIVYYKDDNDFILKLLPTEKDHEIILSMNSNNVTSMTEIVADIEEKTRVGLEEMQVESLRWKYALTRSDRVDIPDLKFNIQSNYPTLEGRKFTAGMNDYIIKKTSQRIAFVLNKDGAIVETESEFETVVFSKPVIDSEVKPKNLIVDKPFFLMLKRIDSKNPYFGLWVANAELMN